MAWTTRLAAAAVNFNLPVLSLDRFDASCRLCLTPVIDRLEPTARRLHLAIRIMNATRAGIVTPSTKTALEATEADVAAASHVLAPLERFEPAKAPPRAREVYRELVDRLTSIDDVSGA